ncbi:MAG: CRTAC1 family protein [Pseudomonadota bacterium]
MSGNDQIIAVAFRRSVWVLLVAGLVVTVGFALRAWLQSEPDVVVETPDIDLSVLLDSKEVLSVPPVAYRDVAAETGIDFVHVNGAYGERLLPETMGGGVAFLDYDNDQDQDLLLVNSDRWPFAPDADTASDRPALLRLYANDGQGQWTEVTEAVGLATLHAYGQGVAVGDYDGDGDVDLYVTAVGSNWLLENRSGQFIDVTAESGTAGDPTGWSSSAGFFDADGDGDLDLLVINYVKWSRALDIEVDYRLTGIGRAYGPPSNFEGTDAYLFINQGNGEFEDRSEVAGIRVANAATGRPVGKGLALVPVDLDEDGDLDVMVANDTVRNFVFRNDGRGQFEEVGTELGLGFDRNGMATGAMGIDFGHYRNDDALAIAIGNFANEMSSLYVARGARDTFADQAIGEGIGARSRLALTFGLFFYDYDADGWLDYMQVNGHVENEINQVQSSQQYRQPAQLFWNCGLQCTGPSFIEADASQRGDLARPIVGRGAAFADIDQDGSLELALTQIAGPMMLLHAEAQPDARWLRVRLNGRSPNTGAIGARVVLDNDGRRQFRTVMPTRSYLSQMELPVTFGLGAADRVDRLIVTWPDGSQTALDGIDANQTLLIDQAAPDPP